MTEEIHVYIIGPDGTEVYAAHSEEEMKNYYRKLCGGENFCEHDLKHHFSEIKDIDSEFVTVNEDGQQFITTWRKLAKLANIPNQLSTGYN